MTVDGAGSTWTNSGDLYVGYSGSGTLNITNGGTSAIPRLHRLQQRLDGHGDGDGAGSTWTNSGDLYVGYSGSGTLNITTAAPSAILTATSATMRLDGHGRRWTVPARPGPTAAPLRRLLRQRDAEHHQRRRRQQYHGYIGYNSGSTGTVTVDGAGSKWTNSGGLYVGYSGSGTLNITNGGGRLGRRRNLRRFRASSTGTINFGANGGTLTTRSLYASPSQLTGTGTVNTRGLVSDIDLVFDQHTAWRKRLRSIACPTRTSRSTSTCPPATTATSAAG